MAIGNDQEGSGGFGLRFRLLMGYHDLTLRDVSAVTGAAISTVSTWRNGRIPSARKTIEEIAKLFRVSPAYLVYGITQNPKEMPLEQGMEEKEIADVEHYIAQNFSNNTELESYANDTPRQRIERYVARYLDKAEQFEGGLEHMWLQLLKEFPIHWFSQAGSFVKRKQKQNAE
ncbi:MAG: helix-turn-helix domain-containing protein [Puniceicoccales bacterium]|jgi:transcriptional regulator with XRE-family HTH domain|nr:helix-turn-helix domain-containing protein [Puniceicoccales bacterium]